MLNLSNKLTENKDPEQSMSNRNERTVSSKIFIWIKELRAPFLTASIIPVLLGTIIAVHAEDSFNAFYFMLTLLAMVLLHSGTNVLNDYYDFVDGADRSSIESTPFSGGSGLLANGSLSPGSVFRYALSLLIIGTVIGLLITYLRGWMIFGFGIMGLISGIFYSASPVKLSARGVGELFVGLNFGPLVVLGSYYVQTQSLTIEPVIASLPIAFLIAAVLYINEYPDYSADKQAGKTNILVRLGKERGVMVYYALMLATYASLLWGVGSGCIPIISLIALATLPLSMKALMVVRNNYNDTEKLLPANALTILIHLITGIILCISYLIDHLFL